MTNCASSKPIAALGPRLTELETELETEPDRIRDIYEVKARRSRTRRPRLSLAGDQLIHGADPTAYSHQEWLGYIQPVGLVVSIPALLEAGAHINRNFVPRHRAFLGFLPTGPRRQPDR